MSRIKVGISDHAPPPFKVEREVLGSNTEFIFLNTKDENDFDPNVLRDLDALRVWRAGISEHTVRHLESCKIVVRYGVGYDAIDITSMNEHGIPFCNVPD